MIREAVKTCWFLLPEGARTVKRVDEEIRRLVDRVLKDMHEDARAFGIED
jgi:hypothetical protein